MINNMEEVILYDTIDTHVHSRYKEYAKDKINPISTIWEAKKWWIDNLCFMPNTSPALIDIKSLEEFNIRLE